MQSVTMRCSDASARSSIARLASPQVIKFSAFKAGHLVLTPSSNAHSNSARIFQLRASQDSEAAPAPVATASAAAADADETVFYEGSGSNAELGISMLLGATLLYLPLTMSSVGRRLWVKYKFTNKRVVVTTNSPVLKREIQVEYSKIKEIRTAPRAFGLWGDCVIFLKDGSRLELVGLEKFIEIRNYVEGFITE